VAPTEVKKISDDMSPKEKDLRCSDDRLLGDGFLYPCELSCCYILLERKPLNPKSLKQRLPRI
jgi:hypothetical protein